MLGLFRHKGRGERPKGDVALQYVSGAKHAKEKCSVLLEKKGQRNR